MQLMTPKPVPDEHWFETTYRAHYDHIYAYCDRRLAHSAEDATAEVFTVAWRKRKKVPEPPLPWLYATARHIVARAWRKDTSTKRLTTKLFAIGPDTQPDHAPAVTNHISDQHTVTDLLTKLPPKDAEVLRLWAWEQLEPQEIAQILGEKPGTIRARLSRAKQKAAAQLTNHTIHHTA